MRKLVFAVSALAIVTVIACSDSATGTVNAADAGNYVLRTMNDTGLPFKVFSDATQRDDIMADTIFMGVDGRFTDKTYRRLTQSGTVTLPVQVTSGTWAEKGATVIFSGSDGSLVTANFSGSQLIITGSQ